MNRQKLALFLLLVVLAGAVVYAFVRTPRQQQVATLKNQPGAKATVLRKQPGAAPTAAAANGGALHLDLLRREQPGFSGFRRNIFSPIFKDEEKQSALKLPPPPPPPKKLPPLPQPLPGASPQAPPPPPPPPTQEQLDDAELGKFVFIGFLKKGAEKTVFLSKGGEIFLAKKGGQVGPRFQVSNVTDDAITIKSLQSDRQLVIPLVENRSLSIRRPSPSPRP
ncbi:type II secretion system protein PulP [Geomonas subterranea]|uniref:Type II secretion system protein PulP n=1 Tax=Geomonas subterranea TaxID=2847989 RepID=A0ABX8LLC5_9BACT|nr:MULTISPECIES: type II secretion system protein PulP [Geomonas]QXE91119.1 type II secretion system protein PulP [Geomonas subterranea]QXM10794.1 type II secretion system protein PulP [Geomonas subterranea]